MCNHIIGYVRDEPQQPHDENDLVMLIYLERSLPLPYEYRDIENPFAFCPRCGGKLFRKLKRDKG